MGQAAVTEKYRLLIIDDNSDIHKDFRTILDQDMENTSRLDAMEQEIFGDAPTTPQETNVYDLDFALQGEEGYQKVVRSLEEDRPFAVAFVDMRMPPGWDGLKTIKHIWKTDPNIQIVICSAYSEYTWQEITQQLGCTDNLLVLKKPFDPAEVAQLSSALSRKWSLARQAALKMVEMEEMVEARTTELAHANMALRHEVSERRSIENALRHAQKMEAIGTLAGGIAHDFNNILFGAMGFAEIAMEDAQSGSRIHNCLKQIVNAHKRAARLVDQILSFSRQTEHEPQVINIHPVIKEAMELLRSSIPSTIEIRKDIDVSCGTVLADPTRIYQVIMNLCTNASQAMGDTGGLLEVSLSEVEVNKEKAAELQVSPGAYARIVVNDSGMGMDEEIKSRVFEPYFTTKQDGHGNGLGLATAYGIVKNHNGSIVVHSAKGEGTKFEVFFPIAGDKARDFLEDLEVPAPVQGHKHILVVDDEKPIIIMEKTTLENRGFQVTATTDSQEALDLFMSNPHSFDAVVTDQTMPNLTGIELAKKMLEVRPDLPIILVTGFSAHITQQKAIDVKLASFLEKPVQTNILAKVVQEAVSGGDLLVSDEFAA